MKRRGNAIFAAVFVSLLTGCIQSDPNARPAFGKETGLPANCRAYVQFALDEYRGGRYTAYETAAGLERNCGTSGALWAYRP